MTVEAMNWALHQQLPPGRAAAKHVLTILANTANADPHIPRQVIAFPSVDYLVWATGQNRKTVMSNLKALQEWGLIEDSGKRTGKTRQIPIYRLNCGPDLFEQSQKRNRSNIGTVPAEPAKGAPESPSNSTDIGTVPISEQSQIVPETVPISGHGTKSNKSRAGGDAHASAREEELQGLPRFDRQLIAPYLDNLPPGVDTRVFVAFVKHRKVIGRVLSISSWLETVALLKRLGAEGVDLNASLKETMALGLAKPVDPRHRGGAPPARRHADDFASATYQGTADHELPDFLRANDPVDPG